MTVLTDIEIQNLVVERKVLKENIREKMKFKPKLGHNEWEYSILGEAGSQFYIIMRSNKQNPIDFSVILGYQIPKTNTTFRLCRYNGKSHEHTNKIEQQTFYDFHIHQATERYQLLGMAEDSYAEPTNKYSDMDMALESLLDDYGFIMPVNPQLKLWE